jgi:hypothetical protein
VLAHDWAARRGASLHALRRKQVFYRPGRSISVVFDATVEWPGGAAGPELLVAAADSAGERQGEAQREGAPPVRFWLYPHDPGLPGLAQLANPSFVREICSRLGLPAATTELNRRAYRPGRRAVIELTGTQGRLVLRRSGARVDAQVDHPQVYLKVLRPGRAEGIRRRLAALSGRLPVPACRYCSDRFGLIVLEGLPGVTLHEALRQASAPPPDGSALVDLLDRLAAVALDGSKPPPTTAQHVRRHARLLGAVLPQHRARIDRFARALGPDAPEPVVTTHNDFYDSQLLVDANGAVIGLLDVDGVGPGQRIDDLASMLGRVWTSGQTGSRGRERFELYAEDLFESFSAVSDPRELSRRTAGVVFGRATGPFRAQQRDWPAKALQRIELAERWLESAAAGRPPR